MEMSKTLLPCQFCGETANVAFDEYQGFLVEHQCKRTGLLMMTRECASDSDAVDAWNDAATTPTIAERKSA